MKGLWGLRLNRALLLKNTKSWYKDFLTHVTHMFVSWFKTIHIFVNTGKLGEDPQPTMRWTKWFRSERNAVLKCHTVQERQVQKLNSRMKRFVFQAKPVASDQRNWNYQTESHRTMFYLKGEASSGETYSLKFLREKSFVQIAIIGVSIGKVASSYIQGRTFHSLLDLGVDGRTDEGCHATESFSFCLGGKVLSSFGRALFYYGRAIYQRITGI